MNVTKLEIVTIESVANYEKGDVIAFMTDVARGWQDPWGGVFDDRDQVEFNAVASGSQDEVNLPGVEADRVVPCRLRVTL